jgi:hypothetical protein
MKMMKTAIGFTLGLLLGTAAAAGAGVFGFYSGSGLINQTPNFQGGYVAGVHDATYSIADADLSRTDLLSVIVCLQSHETDGKLGSLHDWALSQMALNPDVQAADVMIGICRSAQPSTTGGSDTKAAP